MMTPQMRNSLAYKTFRAGYLQACDDYSVEYIGAELVNHDCENGYIDFVKEISTDPRYPLDRHDGRGHN